METLFSEREPHLVAMSKTMYKLQQHGQLCDVNIMVDGESVQAHSLILASCSSHFHEIFSSSNTQRLNWTLEMQQIGADSLKRLIHFMYTGELVVEPSIVTNLLQHSIDLELTRAVTMCQEYILKQEKLQEEKDKPATNAVKPECSTSTLPSDQAEAIAQNILADIILAVTEKQKRASAKPVQSPSVSTKQADSCAVPKKQIHIDNSPVTKKHVGSSEMSPKQLDSPARSTRRTDSLSASMKQMESFSVSTAATCTRSRMLLGIDTENAKTASGRKIRKPKRFLTSDVTVNEKTPTVPTSVYVTRSNTSKIENEKKNRDANFKGQTKSVIGSCDQSAKKTMTVKRAKEEPPQPRSTRSRAKKAEIVQKRKRGRPRKVPPVEPKENKAAKPKKSAVVDIDTGFDDSKVGGIVLENNCIEEEANNVGSERDQGKESSKEDQEEETSKPKSDVDKLLESVEKSAVTTEPDSPQNKKRKTLSGNQMVKQEDDSQSVTKLGKRQHLKCHRCHKKFSTRDVLVEHRENCTARQRNVNPAKKYIHTKCRRCNMSFEDHQSLVEHRKEHVRQKKVNPRRYQCVTCDYVARTEKLQLIHMKFKHDIPFDSNGKYEIMKCEVEGCNYETLYDVFMRRHKNTTHIEVRPFICEVCGLGFKQKMALVVHGRIHDGSKPCVCKICNKAFRQDSTLKYHMERKHSDGKKYLCSCCPFATADKKNLLYHMHSKHGEPLPDNYVRYTCPHCPFITTKKGVYETHIRRHTGERPHTCPQCNRSFHSKTDLRTHQKWHGERKFKCTYEGCNFAAVETTKLKSHIRLMHTHANEKPWQCAICQYRTAVKGNLTKHLRTVHHLEVQTNQHRVVPLVLPQEKKPVISVSTENKPIIVQSLDLQQILGKQGLSANQNEAVIPENCNHISILAQPQNIGVANQNIAGTTQLVSQTNQETLLTTDNTCLLDSTQLTHQGSSFLEMGDGVHAVAVAQVMEEGGTTIVIPVQTAEGASIGTEEYVATNLGTIIAEASGAIVGGNATDILQEVEIQCQSSYS